MPHDWHDEPIPRGNRKPPARLLLVLTGLLSAVLTTGTAASVYVAGDASRRATTKTPAVALFDASAHHHGAQIHALMDSLLAPLGELSPMDSSTLRDAVALLGQRDNVSVWIPVDTSRVHSLDTLEFLRGWARHAPLPAFWGYRPRAWGPALEKLSSRQLGAVKRFVILEEAAADSALLAGDVTTAMTRAREIIAASRHMIDQPVGIDVPFGNYMLQHGAMLLERSAQQAGEPMVASAAQRLYTAASSNYRLLRTERQALLNMGENPTDGRLLAIASDRSLPAFIRFETQLPALVKSACLNPREMMFGLSRARRDAFDRILNALNDIPRMNEVAPSLRARLDVFNAPARYLNALEGTRTKDSFVSLLVPPVLRNRVKYCQLIGA